MNPMGGGGIHEGHLNNSDGYCDGNKPRDHWGTKEDMLNSM